MGLRRRRLLVAVSALASVAHGRGVDTEPHCFNWAETGECESNPRFMLTHCANTCAARSKDLRDQARCEALIAQNPRGCRSEEVLKECSGVCFARFQAELTPDKEGNCFYWATDGECKNNPDWMARSCPRSCAKLKYCGEDPESEACAERFECPVRRDEAPDCPERARRGECRGGPEFNWRASAALRQCSLSCHLLDPSSTSHTATRPLTRMSPLIDIPVRRHQPNRCWVGKEAMLSSLSGICPNYKHEQYPWSRHRRTCPRTQQPLTARVRPLDEEYRQQLLVEAERRWKVRQTMLDQGPSLTGAEAWALGRTQEPTPEELVADHSPDPKTPIWLETISTSPRVRLLHNFVTQSEAAELIRIAEPMYHRSGTARASGDSSRTSYSASLPSSNKIVHDVRHRIARFSGYPEANLEPLQTVRYRGGEYYRAHHDFYNACETWFNGNRHFTFLIYLNEVQFGGETSFPLLNITVTPVPYAALIFNDCLDNGEPDERTLHEGVEPKHGSSKYAINGWMRSRPVASL